MERIAASSHRANAPASWARWFSADWRFDITSVARRQANWMPGFQDWKLLQDPLPLKVSSDEWVLLCGDPALVFTKGALPRVANVAAYKHRITLHARVVPGEELQHRLAAELKLVALLEVILLELAVLNDRSLEFPARAPARASAPGARLPRPFAGRQARLLLNPLGAGPRGAARLLTADVG